MGSATYTIGGGGTSDNISIQYIYILYTRAAPEFWFEGETSKKNFKHEFHSSPVLQQPRQNFCSRGTFSKYLLIKDF